MASSAASGLFELLQSSTTLRNKTDCLVLFLHSLTLAHGFECTGITESGPSVLSRLPEGWNNSSDVYVFRYAHPSRSGKTFLFKLLVVGKQLLVHACRLDSDDSRVNAEFNVDDIVSASEGQFAVANDLSVEKAFKPLLESLVPTSSPSTSSSSSSAPPPPSTGPSSNPAPRRPEYYDPTDPLRAGPPRMPRYGGFDDAQPGGGMIFPPGGIPMGPGPGFFGPDGSLFGPSHPGFAPRFGPGSGEGAGQEFIPGRLPRGAIPPGARFDPYGPPGIGRPPGGGRGFGGGPPDFDDFGGPPDSMYF